MHKHKCSQCGCVWEHKSDCADNEIAHQCPVCRTEQWVKYTGVRGAGFLQKCYRYVPNRSLVSVESIILLGYTKDN